MRALKFFAFFFVLLLLLNPVDARGGGGCFLPGTLVMAEGGPVPIEQLSAGDNVMSFSDKGLSLSPVSKIVEVQRNEYFSILTDGHSVNVTAEHPFYVGNSTYVEASLLKAGDIVYVLRGDRVEREVIRNVRKVDAPVVAYNLEVDAKHTFFANSFAVHNKGCFKAGTAVATPAGLRGIETLTAGDYVYSFDEDGNIMAERVSDTYKVVSSDYYLIRTASDEVSVTAEHPFLTSRGYVTAEDLNAGEIVFVLDSGALAPVEIVSTRHVYEQSPMYNLEVEGEHTFIANSFAVHNKGCFPAGTQIYTPSGTKSIDDVAKGDIVFSFDEKGNVRDSKVTNTYSVLAESYYRIHTRTTEVNVTAEHPFFTGNGYVTVENLKSGDMVYIYLGGELVKDSIVSIEKVEGPIVAYNLEVDNDHTFIANSFAVHNKGCFPAGTKVSTPEGIRNIEELEAGDLVYSFDESGNVGVGRVGEMYEISSEDYYLLKTARNMVNVTAEHPFLTPEGYVSAKNLEEGDIVFVLINERLLPEKIISKEHIYEQKRMYNIEVDNSHTFIANSFAVHNKGCFPAGTMVSTPDGIKSIEDIKEGDVVLSFDGVQNILNSRVVKTYSLMADGYYNLVSERGSIVNVTSEHPFLTDDGFVAAKDLRAGDVIYVYAGGAARPEKVVSLAWVNAPSRVYNLETDNEHTFIANGFLVHNKGGGGSGGSFDAFEFVLILFFVILRIAFDKLSGNSQWSSTISVNKGKLAAKAKKTSALLSMLVKYDPIWDEWKMKDAAKSTFLKLQECWQKREYAEMEKLLMASLYRQHVSQLESMKQNHELNRLDNLKLLDMEIVLVKNRNDKTRDEFTVWLKAEAKDTIVDDRNGKKIRGDTGTGVFEEFWSFQRMNNAWMLRQVDQPEESVDFISEDNYDENATPAMKKMIYSKAGGAANANLSLSPVREQGGDLSAPSLGGIKSKSDKIHRLLNFLYESDKIWDEQKMRDLARECFILVNTAVEQRNALQLSDCLTPKLYGEMQELIYGYVQNKQIYQMRNLAIRNVEIVLVRNYNDRKKDEFVAWVSGQAQKVIFDEETSMGVSGDTYVRDFEEYYTFKRNGAKWFLDSIEESDASYDYLSQANVDEGTSKEMMDWYYSKERTV